MHMMFALLFPPAQRWLLLRVFVVVVVVLKENKYALAQKG